MDVPVEMLGLAGMACTGGRTRRLRTLLGPKIRTLGRCEAAYHCTVHLASLGRREPQAAYAWLPQIGRHLDCE